MISLFLVRRVGHRAPPDTGPMNHERLPLDSLPSPDGDERHAGSSFDRGVTTLCIAARGGVDERPERATAFFQTSYLRPLNQPAGVVIVSHGSSAAGTAFEAVRG